jgi:hypothetical protein
LFIRSEAHLVTIILHEAEAVVEDGAITIIKDNVMVISKAMAISEAWKFKYEVGTVREIETTL